MVERLMHRLGIRGAVRGRRFVRKTVIDDAAVRPADLVKRDFLAVVPNSLWVADVTYVKTHTGWAYVAFIVDVYSRRTVAWQASRSLRADLAIEALEMAVHNRGLTDDLSNLVNHADRGVQYLSVRYSERLEENDIVASVGSRGDSYDNALVESFNGLYKREIIHTHADPGSSSLLSSLPPWNTSTGSTTGISTDRLPTSRLFHPRREGRTLP
jgi:putative transposase